MDLRREPAAERARAPPDPALRPDLLSFGPAPETHPGDRDNLLGDIGRRQVAGTGGMSKGQSHEVRLPD
ncbi:MAG: hypothetical protein ACRDTJ_23940 [Pseudonocardiaceae bacterium]